MVQHVVHVAEATEKKVAEPSLAATGETPEIADAAPPMMSLSFAA